MSGPSAKVNKSWAFGYKDGSEYTNDEASYGEGSRQWIFTEVLPAIRETGYYDLSIDMLRVKLRAAEANAHHGDRLKVNEKEAIAREVADKCPKGEITQIEVADSLGASQQRVSEWIADIRARQTAGRDCLIKKLHLLGWTQREIAEKVGMSKGGIEYILDGNTDFGKTSQEIQVFLTQGKSMDWIAEHYSIDMQFTWALRLYGKLEFVVGLVELP